MTNEQIKYPRPRSLTASEATGFIRGGMLFLEPPHRWRIFDREIWRRWCARERMADVGERLRPIDLPEKIIMISNPDRGGPLPREFRA